MDASGNSVTCIQTIGLVRPALADLSLPPGYNGIDAPGVNCTYAYPTPEWIESQGLQGFPYFMGAPLFCSIQSNYKDAVIEVCDGTYKVVREWTILDACASGVLRHTQVIKVADEQAPVMNCPPDMTVSAHLS